MASFLSDRIVDEILESLSRSQHTLGDHLIRKSQPLLHHEPPMETEVLDEMVLQPETHNQEQKESRDQEKKHGLEDMDTCIMNPKSKRKSILVRMLRPVSVAFEMEFDLDKALEEVPIHVEDPPLPPPPPPPPSSQPLDRSSAYYRDLPPPPTPLDTKTVCLSELPPVEHKLLEHHTKLRPKPKKRTRPSRPHRKTTSSSAPQDVEQNSTMGKLDEGLEDFFSKKVIKLSFKLPSVRGPSSSAQEASDKKRESRKSGFFNLIKSRTSRSEKSHGAASITPPHPVSSTPVSPSPSITPVTEEATPTLPTSPTKNPGTVAEPHPELHRAQSSDHTDSEMEASLTTAEPAEEEKEEKIEEKEDGENKENPERNPHIPRHIGVPVMGMDLLAEMKARQERMAVKKSESSSLQDKVDDDKDIHPHVPVDADESRPEPTPRSKPPSVTPKPPPPQAIKPPLGPRTSGPLSPASPTSPRPSSTSIFDDSAEAPAGSASARAPLPAPRLKRAPSEQERESTSSNPAGLLSPLDVEFPVDGDAFEPPSPAVESGVGGRQWSSLKSSASPPAATEEDRERAKSLPAYVRPPSLADTDLSPAEEEPPSPAADHRSDNKSEDESDSAPPV